MTAEIERSGGRARVRRRRRSSGLGFQGENGAVRGGSPYIGQWSGRLGVRAKGVGAGTGCGTAGIGLKLESGSGGHCGRDDERDPRGSC
jgi:hypothetical protein